MLESHAQHSLSRNWVSFGESAFFREMQYENIAVSQ